MKNKEGVCINIIEESEHNGFRLALAGLTNYYTKILYKLRENDLSDNDRKRLEWEKKAIEKMMSGVEEE